MGFRRLALGGLLGLPQACCFPPGWSEGLPYEGFWLPVDVVVPGVQQAPPDQGLIPLAQQYPWWQPEEEGVTVHEQVS